MNNQKLIKLSEEHYVIVDESEIKEGDYFFHTITKEIEKAIHCCGKETHPYPKVTHSTQPLEWFGGEIIPLSEVEEVIYEYSIDKMAIDKFPYTDEGPLADCIDASKRRIWKDGFKAHQELVKDKLFTAEDLYVAFSCGRTYEKSNHHGVGQNELVDYIKSLKKTEWNIEFDEQGKLKLKSNV